MTDAPSPSPAPPTSPGGMTSGMKWALGCTAAAGLGAAVLCAGVFGLGWTVVRKIDRHVEALQKHSDNIAGKGEVGRLYAEARRAAPFDPAQPPALTAERLAVFLRVRQGLQPVRDRHRKVMAKTSGKVKRLSSFAELTELVESWGELKMEHARLLVKEGMSAEEYARVARLAYGALMRQGVQGPETLADVTGVDDRTLELLRPHLAELRGDESIWMDGLLFATDASAFEPEGDD